MNARIAGAVLRGLLTMTVVLAPALLAPGAAQTGREASAMIGAIAGAVVLFEYGARNPGLIDLRFAPPYNRGRFALVTAVLFLVIAGAHGAGAGAGAGDGGAAGAFGAVAGIAARAGAALDVPGSPVAACVSMVAGAGPSAARDALAATAGPGFVAAWTGAAALSALLWVSPWPRGRASFNIWVNLPTFETAYGLEVSRRLARLGALNVFAGLAAPFAIAAAMAALARVFDAGLDPLSLIWGVTVWAAAPALLLLRGLALLKLSWLARTPA